MHAICAAAVPACPRTHMAWRHNIKIYLKKNPNLSFNNLMLEHTVGWGQFLFYKVTSLLLHILFTLMYYGGRRYTLREGYKWQK